VKKYKGGEHFFTFPRFLFVQNRWDVQIGGLEAAVRVIAVRNGIQRRSATSSENKKSPERQ